MFAMSEVVGQLLAAISSVSWGVAGVAAALAVGACVLVFGRATRDGMGGIAARLLLVVLGAAVAWVLLEGPLGRDFASERRALDARAAELTRQATVPGSALACLDGLAGEAVEIACEKSLFATPEATAAAVSYVAAQLALLSDGTTYARRVDPKFATALIALRKAAEADRFGFVAHVLSVREGCLPEDCRALELLEDASRVRANLSERAYEGYVGRNSANWQGGAPVVTATTTPGTEPVLAGKTPPGNLFFPSSDSIPPVSIMTAEPPAAPATQTTDAKPPAPPRRPAQAGQPPRRPVDLNAAARAPADPAAEQ
jgi:hypothetical protein